MKCKYSCRSAEHTLSRRGFLGTMALGMGASAATPALVQAAVAAEAKKAQKRILTVFLHGGVSQLESWDPKPNTDTGGPFRAISTSVPGIHISELLPLTARQMHRMALVRGINTKNQDHGRGALEMITGRKKDPAAEYPHLGAVAAKMLTPERFPLPGHILIKSGGSGITGPSYLGPRFASVTLDEGQAPQYTSRPAALSEEVDARRNAFRQSVNDRFSTRRRTADTDAYTFSFEQAQQLIARRDIFDVSKEPAKDHQRYGKHDFAQHCLLARRLLEQGIPFVQVNHSNYDTHFENFDYHIEQLGEFDGPFATLLGDLADRGLLQDTLVVVMSEFGRTPRINARYGRDHWGTAWSVALAGAGIHSGAVVGKTNDNGTAVTDREVDHGHLFHTYLRAVGIDSKGEVAAGGRLMPLADPAKGPITELLT